MKKYDNPSKFRSVLLKHRIKIRDIAQRSGVGVTTVSTQASTGIKSIRVAKRYAAVLGCDPLELIG